MNETMNQPMGQTTLGELLPLLIFLGILFLIIIFCMRMAIVTSRQKKERHNELKRLYAEKNASLISLFTHVAGLPIAENKSCQVISCPGQYEFSANGVTFNLEKSKVTDIYITTDVEVQKQYVSSVGGAIGGAIGGALLFGPVGAAIGGRVKEKKTTERFSYLIFTYNSDNEIKQVGFDVTYSFAHAQKFVNEFRANTKTNTVNVNL